MGGVKSGTLRFVGPTEFAPGMWAGIELDDPEGKNDGSVGGISYFKCSSKHGRCWNNVILYICDIVQWFVYSIFP